MPGMVELGEDIFLKPVRRGVPNYNSALADMVSQGFSAVVVSRGFAVLLLCLDSHGFEGLHRHCGQPLPRRASVLRGQLGLQNDSAAEVSRGFAVLQ
jgi:hypothetical protein